MYMLLEGKHPLQSPKDTLEEYTKKLDSPNFQFSDSFSEYIFALN